MENFFTSEIIYNLNALCVYFLLYIANSIFLGRFIAEMIWRKYILEVEDTLRNYNKYIYIPLVLIASGFTLRFIFDFSFEPIKPEFQSSWISATIQFLVYASIPCLLSLLLTRLKESLISPTYYKLNFKINELKALIYGVIFLTIFVYSVPIIFNLRNSGFVGLIDIAFLIFCSLPTIEMIFSFIIFLKESIKVKEIIIFKEKKMKSLKKELKEDNNPFFDIRSYLVLKHGWDFIFINPNDDIELTKFMVWLSRGEEKDEPTFVVHSNIKKLLPKFTKLPSTVVSEVLKKNKMISFNRLTIRSDFIPFDNTFFKFTTNNLFGVYVIEELNDRDFKVRRLDYLRYENKFIRTNDSTLTVSYDMLKIPDYAHLSMKDLDEKDE